MVYLCSAAFRRYRTSGQYRLRSIAYLRLVTEVNNNFKAHGKAGLCRADGDFFHRSLGLGLLSQAGFSPGPGCFRRCFRLGLRLAEGWFKAALASFYNFVQEGLRSVCGLGVGLGLAGLGWLRFKRARAPLHACLPNDKRTHSAPAPTAHKHHSAWTSMTRHS